MKSDNKVGVISGACGGMGSACAWRLGRKMPLIISDHNQSQLADLRTSLEAEGISVIAAVAADIRRPEQVEHLMDTAASAGNISVLMHMAGVSPFMADWRTILEVNLIATENISVAAIKKGQDGIVTVLVTSMAAIRAPRGISALDALLDHPLDQGFLEQIEPFLHQAPDELSPPRYAYVLSKYGVARHIRRRVRDYAARHGRIVGIAPGVIDTTMGRLESRPGTPGSAFIPNVPLARLGTADEVAAVAEFVVSDSASFVTGCEWAVDGGITAVLSPQ